MELNNTSLLVKKRIIEKYSKEVQLGLRHVVDSIKDYIRNCRLKHFCKYESLALYLEVCEHFAKELGQTQFGFAAEVRRTKEEIAELDYRTVCSNMFYF